MCEGFLKHPVDGIYSFPSGFCVASHLGTNLNYGVLPTMVCGFFSPQFYEGIAHTPDMYNAIICQGSTGASSSVESLK